MIAVTQSRQLERFGRQVGRDSKLQAVKCKCCADAKAQYATYGFPPNRSSQVVDRVRRGNLLAFSEFPVDISEDGRCRRVAVMRSKIHQHVAGGRKVTFCRQDGGLEYLQDARVAGEV